MADYIISGIQQLGVGIPNVHEAFRWYRKHFRTDIKIFEEAATAALMLPYTGGEPRDRHAILAINMQGGGGFEIWQYTSRKPQPAEFDIQFGDLGICCGKIKTKDIQKTYDQYKADGLDVLNEPKVLYSGTKVFYVRDPYGNLFQIIESIDWFRNENYTTGGVYGAVVGTSDIEASLKLYRDVLGYDKVLLEEEGTFEDLKELPGGKDQYQRVVLTHSKPRAGGFSKMLGSSQIELLHVKNRTPKKIFENRFWGDLGFIHLCFDIKNMDALQKRCEEMGFPFTVDSSDSFDMGEAAGRFSYVEDPDGTLIEFVETHKLPLVKKIGWYLDLRKRDPQKPLPDWMLGMLRFSRVK